MKALVILILIAAAAYAAWTYRAKIPMLHDEPKFDSGPIRVVGQRPGGSRRALGAKLSEPEAVMTLRQHFAPQVKSECLALASRGSEDQSYVFEAVDSCSRVKLGRWRVDGTTGEVRQYPARGNR